MNFQKPKFTVQIPTSLGELLAVLRALLLFPFVEKGPDQQRPGPALFCVHGHIHNNSPWGKMRKYLQSHGMGPVHSFSYPSILVDIPQAAAMLKEQIELFSKEQKKPIDILIGHSEGGLVALEYALTFAPKERKTVVIALGSPLLGTRLARLAFGPGGRQMLPNSSYLKLLKKRLKEANHVQFIAFASRHDGVIRPVENAVWEEFPHEYFENLGHMQLIFSEKIYKQILHAIDRFQSQNL